MPDQILAYVRHSDVTRWLDTGWIVVLPGLQGTSHGNWSVLMRWLCECKCPDMKADR